LQFQYHGNYCGPGYGDSSFQKEAIDKLDSICKAHDFHYDADEADLYLADLTAAYSASGNDYLFSTYFYLQALARYIGLMPRKGKGKKKIQNEVRKAAQAAKREVKNISKKAARRSKGRRGSKVQGLRVANDSLGRSKMSMSPKSGNTHLISHDFAIDVSVTADQTLGNVITTYGLEPSAWAGTRLAVLAGLYEKWYLKSVLVSYKPACATTVPGSFIMYVDSDPSDAAGSTGITLVHKAASAQNRVQFQCFEPKTLRFRPPPGTQSMFTSNAPGGDDRLVSFGNVFIVNDTPLTPGGAQVYGNLYITLNIEFLKPILESLPTSLALSQAETGSTTWETGVLDISAITPVNPQWTNAALGNFCTLASVKTGTGPFGWSTSVTFTRSGVYLVVMYSSSGNPSAFFNNQDSVTFNSQAVTLVKESFTLFQEIDSSGITRWPGFLWQGYVTVPELHRDSDGDWVTSGGLFPFIQWVGVPNGASGSGGWTSFTDPDCQLIVQPVATETVAQTITEYKKKEIKSYPDRLLAQLEKSMANMKIGTISPIAQSDNNNNKANNNPKTTPKRTQSFEESPMLDTCFFCGMEDPDHLGRNCPKNPNKKNPVTKNVTTSN
jgi:hypothetical protein